jgi:Glucokinase
VGARFTNRGWVISEQALRDVGFEEAVLINDFAALALAVGLLEEIKSRRDPQADNHVVGISGITAWLSHVLDVRAQVEQAGDVYAVEEFPDILGALHAGALNVRGRQRDPKDAPFSCVSTSAMRLFTCVRPMANPSLSAGREAKSPL